MILFIMAEIKYYKCSRCGKITKHIEDEDRFLIAGRGLPSVLREIPPGFLIVLPKRKVVGIYKCTECGCISKRFKWRWRI